MHAIRIGRRLLLICLLAGSIGCQGPQGAEKVNSAPANVEKVRKIQELDFPEEKNAGKSDAKETADPKESSEKDE